MSSTLHEEIAKARFLALREEQLATPQEAVDRAIKEATVFTNAYAAWRRAEAAESAKFRGCKACFGSGGKKASPCAVCNGTGQVLVSPD